MSNTTEHEYFMRALDQQLSLIRDTVAGVDEKVADLDESLHKLLTASKLVLSLYTEVRESEANLSKVPNRYLAHFHDLKTVIKEIEEKE